MNTEKFLPIGTVCLLKNAKKRVMITGFAVTSKETGNKMFDYIGCLYPEGVISSNQNLLFDHNQIEKIFFMGFIDDEQRQLKIKLNQFLNKNNINNNVSNTQTSNLNVQQTQIENQNINNQSKISMPSNLNIPTQVMPSQNIPNQAVVLDSKHDDIFNSVPQQ